MDANWISLRGTPGRGGSLKCNVVPPPPQHEALKQGRAGSMYIRAYGEKPGQDRWDISYYHIVTVTVTKTKIIIPR